MLGTSTTPVSAMALALTLLLVILAACGNEAAGIRVLDDENVLIDDEHVPLTYDALGRRRTREHANGEIWSGPSEV